MEVQNNKKGTKESKNKNNNEDIKDTQFYLITLEDSNGEHQQIKIFRNSDSAEIAFNFCKDNNLDYKSMKYIKKNIQKIIEKFDEPNHKLFFLDNSYSSIQEVDEENLVSENTLLDNEAIKDKNSNKKRIKEIKFNDNNKEEKINTIKNTGENNEENNKIIKTNSNNNCNTRNNVDTKTINNKNENILIQGNNNELITKNNNIKIDKKYIKENDINLKENKSKQTDNSNENLKEKEQKNCDNFPNKNKSKKYYKFDLDSIRKKMNEIKLKNSVIINKKDKKIENIEMKSNYKKINNQINTNIKNPHLSRDKSINTKKNEISNENILDKYLKALILKNNNNTKSKNNNSKKEEALIENKTFIENMNKFSLKNNKNENLIQKRRKNKNILLLHNTDILNSQILQTKSKKENDIFQSDTRLTPKKSDLFKHSKKISNPLIKFKPKKEKIIKLRNILQSNKQIFANILSNILTQNYNKSNNNKIMRNCYNQIQDKNLILTNKINKKNNRRKNSNLDKNEFEKYSFDLIKSSNEINKNKNKGKRNKELKNGLNNFFNYFMEHKKNNVMNTNYVINKRFRLINDKKKKNISMNLSRYNSSSKNRYKSKKNSLEINISNNNCNRTYVKENEKEKENIIKRPLTNKNSYIFSNNTRNILNIINSKKLKHNLQQKHFTISNYNENIKNYRVLNTINSYKMRKIMKNKTKNASSHRKLNKNEDIYNISNSYSLLINSSKPHTNDDYNLNVLDQYYTINNTINITNNNNSVINDTLNKEKSNKNDKIINLAQKIYKNLDKDNIGFIILKSKQKLNHIFMNNNLLLNKDQEQIIKKVLLFLFDIHKRNNNYELNEDKIILNEKSFIKLVKYILLRKLNINERNVFLSIENNSNFTNKKIIL